MNRILSKKGVSLVELMITMLVFSLIFGMIYSVYISFVKQATTERKTSKTEFDIVNAVWPMNKEILSAGFGTPSSGTCTPGITLIDADTVQIHSPAAGDNMFAGQWSYIGSGCAVSGMENGQTVVVINPLDKSRIGTATIVGGQVGAACDAGHVNQVAYRIPPAGLECYETNFSLEAYGTPPAMCAPNTGTISRSSSAVGGGSTSYQPMIDCVRALAFRFGCVSAAGGLRWQTGDDCGTATRSLIKVGAVIQSSPRRDFAVTSPTTLFGDLRDSAGTSLAETVTLTGGQEFYKWRNVEQVITLRNPE